MIGLGVAVTDLFCIADGDEATLVEPNDTVTERADLLKAV
jgi:hypothetical protein